MGKKGQHEDTRDNGNILFPDCFHLSIPVVIMLCLWVGKLM